MSAQVTDAGMATAVQEAIRGAIEEEAQRLVGAATAKFAADLTKAAARIAGDVFTRFETQVETLTGEREIRVTLVFRRERP